ncbi:aldose 1-epimerase [Actinomycetota bacterium]|nr:aldose 1-epimerase [Actinomycetota bacterium]
MSRPGGAGGSDAERLIPLTSPTGRVRATVDRRGGGLHSLTRDGEPLTETYDAAGAAPYCAGAVLFPWPNRVRGGTWVHDGITLRLDVNEPELGNANHGLVRDAPVAVRAQQPDRVTVVAVVEPRPGYPFHVALATTYTAEESGLRVEHTIENRSAGPAPVALGTHPYLRVGQVPTEDLRLAVLAERHLPVDAALVPVADVPVDADMDLRDGPVLGRRELNVCYHGLTTQDPGEERYRHVLTAPDGRATELWADAAFGYVQVYVCDHFPGAGGALTRAVAVEPMTAAPDALNSGRGLRWLAAGETWDVAWGIRAVGAR